MDLLVSCQMATHAIKQTQCRQCSTCTWGACMHVYHCILRGTQHALQQAHISSFLYTAEWANEHIQGRLIHSKMGQRLQRRSEASKPARRQVAISLGLDVVQPLHQIGGGRVSTQHLFDFLLRPEVEGALFFPARPVKTVGVLFESPAPPMSMDTCFWGLKRGFPFPTPPQPQKIVGCRSCEGLAMLHNQLKGLMPTSSPPQA
jgi:hypothetical protein